jgi:hypothetical protein
VNYSTRTVFLSKGWIFRIVVSLRLFFGIKVVEVAKKLVESVDRRKMLVLIAEMVFAKLTCGLAFIFQ